MSKLVAISVGTLLLSLAACGPAPEANTAAAPAASVPPVPSTQAPADPSESESAAPPAATSAPTTAKGVIEAYFAAVKAGDKEAAFALLTPDAQEHAKTSRKSFTYVFFQMGFKVKTWKLKNEVKEQGDEASGYVGAVLIDDQGEDDREGMHFELVRADASWLIAEIN